jgi:hypothetical protein
MSLCPPMWNSEEGATRARRRRIMNHKTMPAVKAAPTRPPTTPPAILPAILLPPDDGSDEEGDTDEGALGVTVDWLFLVEVGTMATLPVTSGESVTGPSMHKRLGFVGKATHRQQAVPPVNPSYLQPVGVNEMRSIQKKKGPRGYSWVKICPTWHSRPHRDWFREAGG